MEKYNTGTIQYEKGVSHVTISVLGYVTSIARQTYFKPCFMHFVNCFIYHKRHCIAVVVYYLNTMKFNVLCRCVLCVVRHSSLLNN